jgi:YkoY family integral membrane protein
MWQSLVDNFSKFGSMSQFDMIFTWSGLALIFTLCVMEGLLSVDNALVLGAKVKPLPEKQRTKALMFGIWGAYIFRFLMIGLGTFLIKFMWIKALGAGYLLYMAIKGLMSKSEGLEEPEAEASSKNFWLTVLSIELLDITFSIDSVTAALALSDEVWVLMIGAMLGILMMRGIANQFVKLLKAIPEFEKTAFVLIFIIGARLGLTLFGIEIPDIALFVTMAGAFLGTFVVHRINKAKEVTA